MDLFKNAKRTNELLEKADVVKALDKADEILEKAGKANEELLLLLRKRFIDIPYKVQKVKTKGITFGSDYYKEIYYPVLEEPEGFMKEDEKYQLFGNSVFHDYTLKDGKGRKIKIGEKAKLKPELSAIYQSVRGGIYLKNGVDIILETITYEIDILDRCYELSRKIPYQSMLEQIGAPDETLKVDLSFLEKENEANEEAYKQFINGLDVMKMLPSLKDMYKFDGRKFKISLLKKNSEDDKNNLEDTLRIEIKHGIKEVTLVLENERLVVNLNKNVVVKTISIFFVYMGEYVEEVEKENRVDQKEYEYSKLLEEEKWKTGITLQEVIAILKCDD